MKSLKKTILSNRCAKTIRPLAFVLGAFAILGNAAFAQESAVNFTGEVYDAEDVPAVIETFKGMMTGLGCKHVAVTSSTKASLIPLKGRVSQVQVLADCPKPVTLKCASLTPSLSDCVPRLGSLIANGLHYDPTDKSFTADVGLKIRARDLLSYDMKDMYLNYFYCPGHAEERMDEVGSLSNASVIDVSEGTEVRIPNEATGTRESATIKAHYVSPKQHEIVLKMANGGEQTLVVPCEQGKKSYLLQGSFSGDHAPINSTTQSKQVEDSVKPSGETKNAGAVDASPAR